VATWLAAAMMSSAGFTKQVITLIVLLPDSQQCPSPWKKSFV
jgi:hypothetical protein